MFLFEHFQKQAPEVFRVKASLKDFYIKKDVCWGLFQKLPENFDIKHLRWNKIDLSKETKKASKKRCFVNFRSRSEVFCKTGTSTNGRFWNLFVET